jgi:hypothetical protein
MTIDQLIANKYAERAAKLAARNDKSKELRELRDAEAPDDARIAEVRSEVVALDGILDGFAVTIAGLESERAADQAADALARETTPGATSPSENRSPAVVKSEARTYAAEIDPKGVQFLQDVARSSFGDQGASAKLQRHMQEERVERGAEVVERATSANYAGLVVPQYLTDLIAPYARAGRPFADICRSHSLPETGMVVNISKVSTGTTTDLQAAEGDTVSETGIDDTLIPISIQTNAGSQSISRQALERGVGVEDVTLEDLGRAYGTRLDSTLINQATNGLTNVATNIAYTDASPTAAELYPKLLAAISAVEGSLLDMDPNDTVVVMHSRRWYWLQSQLSSTFPLFGQPGLIGNQIGTNDGVGYGKGFRGMLPNGTPVVVDNNISTALGAGTEDEIYVGARSEFHLWEDPSAPLLIKAEQNQAKKLLVDFVLYGYFGYTHARRAHVQKISGTGLIAPTF